MITKQIIKDKSVSIRGALFHLRKQLAVEYRMYLVLFTYNPPIKRYDKQHHYTNVQYGLINKYVSKSKCAPIHLYKHF